MLQECAGESKINYVIFFELNYADKTNKLENESNKTPKAFVSKCVVLNWFINTKLTKLANFNNKSK